SLWSIGSHCLGQLFLWVLQPGIDPFAHHSFFSANGLQSSAKNQLTGWLGSQGLDENPYTVPKETMNSGKPEVGTWFST
ncbi:hypothetical protein ACQP3L_39915, partial [Escherichia coli]